MFGDAFTMRLKTQIKDPVASHAHEVPIKTIYMLAGEGKFYFNYNVKITKAEGALQPQKKTISSQ